MTCDVRCESTSTASLRTLPSRVGGDDFFFTREAVIAGLGIGVMAWFMANLEVVARRIVRVLPHDQIARGTMHVVYPSVKPLPATVPRSRHTFASTPPRILGFDHKVP